MGKSRRKHSPEFKLEAVKMVGDGGHPVTDVAERLGINASLLHTWKKRYLAEGEGAFGAPGRRSPGDEELREVRRELSRVRQERDIPKKKRWPTSRTTSAEVPVHPGPPGDLRSRPDVRCAGGLPERFLCVAEAR